MTRSVDIYLDVSSRLTKSERQWLLGLAVQVCSEVERKPVFVNIGVSQGCSMHCLRAGCESARLVGIDVRDQKVVGSELLNAELVIADSHEWHVHFQSPVDLLFVDGNHSFDGVTADLNGWMPKVPIGGIATFHDYGGSQPAYCRVREALDAWLGHNGSCWSEVPAVDTIRALRRVE